MSRFFPRETVQWRQQQQLHPLRAFSLSTLELAGLTGVVLRLYRAVLLTATVSVNWAVFVFALVGGVLFLCGMLTWHLGNFPLRRWPLRAAFFVAIEAAAEFGVSSVLIALRREPLGTGVAGWSDWWSLAGQTLVERSIIVLSYTLILAACVQIVRRLLDRKNSPEAAETLG